MPLNYLVTSLTTANHSLLPPPDSYLDPCLNPSLFLNSKFFIGGNFKANGTVADATKLIATLNTATIAGA